jgi:hypothetical protein
MSSLHWQLVRQVSVVIDNAPGTLARICGALRDQRVNILGFAAWGESDHGIVRMICDTPLKALDILEEAGMIAVQQEIVEVTCENRPGILFELAQVLQTGGVNINYAYGSTPEQDRGAMYLGVSDLAAARKILKSSVQS